MMASVCVITLAHVTAPFPPPAARPHVSAASTVPELSVSVGRRHECLHAAPGRDGPVGRGLRGMAGLPLHLQPPWALQGRVAWTWCVQGRAGPRRGRCSWPGEDMLLLGGWEKRGRGMHQAEYTPRP